MFAAVATFVDVAVAAIEIVFDTAGVAVGKLALTEETWTKALGLTENNATGATAATGLGEAEAAAVVAVAEFEVIAVETALDAEELAFKRGLGVVWSAERLAGLAMLANSGLGGGEHRGPAAPTRFMVDLPTTGCVFEVEIVAVAAMMEFEVYQAANEVKRLKTRCLDRAVVETSCKKGLGKRRPRIWICRWIFEQGSKNKRRRCRSAIGSKDARGELGEDKCQGCACSGMSTRVLVKNELNEASWAKQMQFGKRQARERGASQRKH